MADVFKCANCQASLKVEPGRQTVVCEYCGGTNVLRRGVWGTGFGMPAPLPTPSASPPPFSPFIPPMPAPPVLATAPYLPPRWTKGGAIVVAVLVIAVVVQQVIVRTGTSRDSWMTPPCLVDANGDDVLDVAGLADRNASGSYVLAVVDGATGDYLWQGAAVGSNDDLLCAGPAFFAVDRTDYRLQLFDVRRPDRSVNVTIDSHIKRFAVGPECLQLELDNGKQRMISLRQPPTTACEAGSTWMKPFRFAQSVLMTPADASGGVTYAVTVLDADNTTAVVTASRGDQRLWQTELRRTMSPWTARALTTPRALVVYGNDLLNAEAGTFVGLDPRTGAVLYTVRQESTYSADLPGADVQRAVRDRRLGLGPPRLRPRDRRARLAHRRAVVSAGFRRAREGGGTVAEARRERGAGGGQRP
jgi:hypothetical protein